MGLRWYTTVVDSPDPRALADWWAEALGWRWTVLADPDGNEFCVLSSRDS